MKEIFALQAVIVTAFFFWWVPTPQSAERWFCSKAGKVDAVPEIGGW